jgi:uncharacterized protein
MKKNVILFLLALLSLQGWAQKPTLTEASLNRLSYQLPDINPEDSLALQQAVVALGTQVRSDIEQLLQGHVVKDPSVQQVCAELLMFGYILEAKYQQALKQLATIRSLLTIESDKRTYGVKLESYLQASLASRHARDTTFAYTVRQTTLNAYQAVPATKVKQLVNQAKASYQEPYRLESYKRIITGWPEIRKNGQGKLTVAMMRLVLPTYIYFVIHRQVSAPALEALQAIDGTQITSQTVLIPMRDGIKLGAEIFTSSANSPSLPVILSVSPYPNPFTKRYGHAFASAGYVYVLVDSRGRGKSEGKFIPFEQDSRDIYDVIDWIARQPWCNGQIGMTGGSYLGFTQWAAIKTKHPALKAINPVAAVAPGIDFPKTNNIYWPYMLRWLGLVEGKTYNVENFYNEAYWNNVFWQLYNQQLPFYQADSILGKPNEIFHRWLAHPAQDAYWDQMLPTPEEYAQLDIPVFTITGYADDDQPGALHYYQQHLKYNRQTAQSNHYVLIGPYDHYGVQWVPDEQMGAFPVEKEALIPMYEVIIGWFDFVLKGKPKPAVLQDKVNYFVMGTGQWKHLPAWAAASTDTLRLHLTHLPASRLSRKATGTLVTKPVESLQKTSYTFHTGHRRDSAEVFQEQATDSDSVYLFKEHNVLYESEPLPADIEISDFLQVQLYLSLSVPDADLQVKLYELMPDGKSFPLGESLLRARYRTSAREATLIKPGKINIYTFDRFYFISKKLQKGSRIRLTFQHLNSPFLERNYGSGGIVSKGSGKEGRKVKAVLYQGGKYPSQLIIPYSGINAN